MIPPNFYFFNEITRRRCVGRRERGGGVGEAMGGEWEAYGLSRVLNWSTEQCNCLSRTRAVWIYVGQIHLPISREVLALRKPQTHTFFVWSHRKSIFDGSNCPFIFFSIYFYPIHLPQHILFDFLLFFSLISLPYLSFVTEKKTNNNCSLFKTWHVLIRF